MLKGKKILLGVCGSIAAYKSAYLIRFLIKSGAEVKVITTTSALDFIPKLTLSTLSKNPVYTEFVKNDQGEWNNHVDLALWADLMIVAPLSANTLAKLAHGRCDNLLTAVYLSAKCPVLLAPAMDLDMYKHPSTQQNLQQVTSYGNHVLEAGHGELASGLVGQGRMAEPEEILEWVNTYFAERNILAGVKVMLTAGPTQEALDPVRFISNHSTGKMGYELAKRAVALGAEVTLISGPTHLPQPEGLTMIAVRSAAEMYAASLQAFDSCHIAILSAAVADYTPKVVADQKIKKKEAEFHLELTKTTDIARELGLRKKDQLLIGFALETQQEIENAKGKLSSKNLDLIVLNSLQDAGAGFGHDTNKISILDRHNNIHPFELKSKKAVAIDIWKIILEYRQSPKASLHS